MGSSFFFHTTLNYIENVIQVARSYIIIPVGNYMFKVSNRNTRPRCEVCSKLTINTPEQRHWRRSCVFIVNFEYISHLVQGFLVLTLSR